MSTHIYKNPEAYAKNNNLQYQFAMKALAEIKIRTNERVLDIGCGDGTITHEMSMGQQACIIGTDISIDMISYANKQYTNNPYLRFLQMDAAQNIFTEQFDLITSFNCLHWVKNQQEALNGISNALVKDGRMVLLLSHKKSLYHHALDKLCSKPEWQPYFKAYENPRSFFEINDYKSMLSVAGLEVNIIREEELLHKFEDINQLKNYFLASMAHVKKIPAVQQNDFLEDFIKVFLNDSDNTTDISLSYHCLLITGYKAV